jgi:Tfp pilus assembly protein PilV
MRSRLADEAGIGLIELLIALTVLTVAIGGLLAVFASSVVSLRHSSTEGTAISLADRQLESYRSMPFSCIPSTVPATAPSGCGVYISFPNPYAASQVTTQADSPDHRIYKITTRVTTGVTGSATQIQVTVALNSGGPTLAQETSDFSTAGISST